MKKSMVIRIVLVVSAAVVAGIIQVVAQLSGLPSALLFFGMIAGAWFAADKISAQPPADTKLYYSWCNSFLEPYMANDFAKETLRLAKAQLEQDQEQSEIAKERGSSYPDYRYYSDFYNNRNNSGVCRAWAIVYIHYQLHRRSGYMTIRPSDDVIAARKALTSHIDNLYAGLVSDKTACPRSFIDGFIPE